MGVPEVFATIVTKKKYIGVVKGRLKNTMKDIIKLNFNDMSFINIDKTKGEDLKLEDIVHFPYKEAERDINKFIDNVYSIEILNNVFVKNNYYIKQSRLGIEHLLKKYERKTRAIFKRRHWIIKEMFKDILNYKRELSKEFKQNVIRLDDTDLLKMCNESNILIFGGIPKFIDENLDYIILEKNGINLKCYIPNMFKKKFPKTRVELSKERKKEILVGGSYYIDEPRLIISYIKPIGTGKYLV